MQQNEARWLAPRVQSYWLGGRLPARIGQPAGRLFVLTEAKNYISQIKSLNIAPKINPERLDLLLVVP